MSCFTTQPNNQLRPRLSLDIRLVVGKPFVITGNARFDLFQQIFPVIPLFQQDVTTEISVNALLPSLLVSLFRRVGNPNIGKRLGSKTGHLLHHAANAERHKLKLQLSSYRLLRPEQRTPWQGMGTSFNYDEVAAPIRLKDGREVQPTTMARISGVVLKQTDRLVGKLGNPVGIKSYKPFHAAGDDFLPNYLGMIGLPMDIYPAFPEDQQMVLLTAQAAADAGLMEKIKAQLQGGREVVITSGLLKAIPDKIAEVAELRCDDLKALVSDFGRYGQASRDLLIPQVRYYTNDAWEVVSAGRPLTGGVSGFPILLRAPYATGNLYVLTVPDDMGNLYDYPAEALNEIRRIMGKDLEVRLEGPSKVGLFLYDNRTLVVENFNDEPVDIRIVVRGTASALEDLETGDVFKPLMQQERRWSRRGEPYTETVFRLKLLPHSYKGLKYE